MRVPTLHTQRLRVRELIPDDLDAVHALLDASDAAVRHQRQRWLDWTVLSYGELATLNQPPYSDRAIVLRATNQLIGLCGFAPCLGPFGRLLGEPVSRGAIAEIGLYWAIAGDFRRNGYATEAGRALVAYAFDTLRLRRIIATTTFDNAASIGVMRKLAMRLVYNRQPSPEWLQVVGVLESPI